MDKRRLDEYSSAAGTQRKNLKGDGRTVTPLSLLALARVQLDDQRFLDVGAVLVAVRRLLEHAFELRSVDADPVRQALAFGKLDRIGDAQLLLGLLAHRDRVADLHEVRRDVDDFTVHGDAL